jgi:DNA-binding transcriptional ArsR family regulator
MSRRANQAAARQGGAPIFAALGDETRLGIVTRLCRSGPASIASLTEGAGVTRQAVAKHLRILEDAGLARATRAGRETNWQLLPGGLDEARASLDRISEQWGAALERLRVFVEDRPKR